MHTNTFTHTHTRTSSYHTIFLPPTPARTLQVHSLIRVGGSPLALGGGPRSAPPPTLLPFSSPAQPPHGHTDATVAVEDGSRADDKVLCTAHSKPLQLYNKRTCALLCLDCYFTAGEEQRCVSYTLLNTRPALRSSLAVPRLPHTPSKVEAIDITTAIRVLE